MSTNLYNQLGFGIIEIIIAMALFVMVAAVGTTTILGSFSVNRLGSEETEATVYAQQGLDAVRSIKKQGWQAPFLATNCNLSCGISSASGSWAWAGANNSNQKFTRTLSVSDVQRDTNGEIVISNGVIDPDTKKITATVNWDFAPSRNNTVSLATYLTNFGTLLIGNWSAPEQEASINLSGNNDGYRIQTNDNYAYLIRESGSPNFIIIDISNPASPAIVGSLNLNGSPQNIFVSENYAYVVNSDNSRELQIISVSSPSNPILTGTYNDSGNDDAVGIYVDGQYAYLAMNGGNDLVIVNVSNPASPIYSGGLNLSGSARDIVVQGSYAFIASTDNSQELQIVDVSSVASPVLTSSLNLSGNTDATTIASTSSTVFIGRSSSITTVNISNPLAPVFLGSVNTSGTVTDIALNLGNDSSYLFISTTDNSQEFQVVDVTTLASPTVIGSVNTSGNQNLNGVAYNTSLDRAVTAGDTSNQEFIVIRPE